MKLVVEITGGARTGQRLEFEDPEVVRFGRHPSCEVVFDAETDRDASARHAELRKDGAIFCLYDMNSANGTVVDGVAARGRVPVAPGAEIEFGAGGPRCRVHYTGLAASTVPPTVMKPGARPPTQLPVGQRTVKMMLDQALKRAHATTRSLVIVIVVVIGIATSALGYWIRGVRRAARGAEIARATHDAIFLLTMKSSTGEESGFCSAFAVRADVAVTNAHCVAAAEDYRRRGGTIFVIQNGKPETRLRVIEMKRIEGFVRGGDRITPDVGWLRVDGRLATTVELATRAEYESLAVGDPIYAYGFPGRLSDAQQPEATFVEGVVGRVTTLEGGLGAAPSTRLIQHSAFTSGGTSGSPIFNSRGKVVAVNTGGYVESGQSPQGGGEVVTRPLSGYNFAMRVDLVEQLLGEVRP